MKNKTEDVINRIELFLVQTIILLDVRAVMYCNQLYCSVRKQVVNVPSYIVRLDSQKHIDFSLRSPYGGGRPGNSDQNICLDKTLMVLSKNAVAILEIIFSVLFSMNNTLPFILGRVKRKSMRKAQGGGGG